MSGEWPPLDESCYHFQIIAIVGDYDPQQIQMTSEPATEHDTKAKAPGPEADTFVLVRPIYQRDEPQQLVIEVSRKGWFEGQEPQPGDLTTLEELMRRMNPFFDKDCTVYVSGDYFVKETEEVPKPIKIASGPFGSGTSRFESVVGVLHVDDESAAQQILWQLRPDGLYRINISGWFKGLFAPDTVAGTTSAFNDLFRIFREAEVQGE